MREVSCECGTIFWVEADAEPVCTSCGRRGEPGRRVAATAPSTPAKVREIAPGILRELDDRRRRGLAMASNPCATELSRVFHIRRHPAVYRKATNMLKVGAFVFALGVCFGVGRERSLVPVGGAMLSIAFILLTVGARKLWLQVEATRRKFRWGCVLPAVVIDRNPWKVAVYTDLRTGPAGRPAVKVIAANLNKLTGGTPVVGQRIACVATYGGNPRETAWENFYPSVVGLGVRSKSELAAITATLGEGDWYIAERMIAALPTRDYGLHRMWRSV